ncbi:MAG: glutamate--tRNA ligase [Candidatus Nealsonbacteria bacterium]|nr:glutamate--tRNA ligase [Candidatus Nealsonbacteria bacterium]
MINEFKQLRVRFAPSPTGKLHLGNARAALFNYLFAKKEKGKFILRIEDTDLERSSLEFEKDIIGSLKWFGIEWNEFYRQSERIETYAKYLEKLINDGKAYHCFCSEEELEAKRHEQMSGGLPPVYSGKCRNLSDEEVKKNQAEGKKSIIRFKSPEKKVKFRDLIRGEVEFDSSLIGDFSLAKDLVTPLYNFAVVVDDFEMKISHVIRGEDHISNTPKQILLQEALNFSQPKYAHLPIMLGPDRAKLSKRHGDTSVSDYREQGYLPEAMVNFMAFLGWNPGTEREIYSMNDLIKDFSLERIQKGGAIFDIERLNYLNGVYIRQKSLDELTELCLPFAPNAEKKQLKKAVALYQERLKKLSEIAELTDFFFKDVLEYNKELLKWKNMTDGETKEILDKLDKILCDISDKKWTKENLEKILMPEAESLKDRGKLLWPLRVALTGKKASAGPFEVAEALGKEKTLDRIKQARELIK